MKKTLFLVLVLAVILSAIFVGCNDTSSDALTLNIVEENVEIKEIGATVKLNATVSNGGTIEWSSADESIATVSSDGTVTAVANGVTEITATSGGVADTCVIVVNQAIIPELGLSVSFPKTSAVLSATLSETYVLKANVTKNEVEVTGATLTWSSSDESKAKVSDTGVITAISNTDGEPVAITCKAEYEGEWAEATFYVTVKDDTDITFLTSQKVFYTTDEEILLPISVKINGINYNGTPEYSSGDTTVVKVVNNKLIPVGTGSVTVYASVNGEAKGYDITIRQKLYVSTTEEFLSISAGNEHVTYELSNDITLTNDDFTYENIGGTGVKTVKVYGIPTFKGELLGNGYKVRYIYAKDYAGEFNNENFVGLFNNIEATAMIKEVVFEGDITVDYPHMYTFANSNLGLIENCFIRTSRRQLAIDENSTAWNKHWNTSGGVFQSNAGRIKDTIVYASYYAGATDTTDKGDNLVMYGAQGTGTYENVAFVSAFTRIGNHAGANWNKALHSSELVKLVHYSSMDKFTLKDGNQITNPTNSSKYGDYVRTACTDQAFDETVWEITDSAVKMHGKLVFETIRISTNHANIILVGGIEESVQIEADVNHDDKEFTFTSSNEEIATVTEEGLVELVGEGTTSIVIKHNATGMAIGVPVKVIAEATAISTSAQLKAYAVASSESTYGYLTNDITLTEADLIEDDTSRYFITDLKGILDGKGYKITYNYYAADGISFGGLIKNVASSAIIKNVVIDGSFSTKSTGGRALFNTFEGALENAYLKLYREQREPSGNNQLTGSIIAVQNGIIRNTVINASGIVGDGTKGSKGLPLQNTGSGTYQNVALVTAEKSIGWRTNGVYGTTINADKLINFRYYEAMADLTLGNGFTVAANTETEARYDYKFTPVSGVQEIGSAWTITEGEVKLSGNSVWKGVALSANVESIQFVQDEVESVEIIAYVNGEPSNSTVSFTSSNESVVTVNARGEAIFVGVGEAKITIKHKESGATITIPVFAKMAGAVSTAEQFIALSTVGKGEEVYLTDDIVLTDSHAGENTSFVTEFKGILNGNGYKVTFTYGEDQAKEFYGLFGKVSGQINNLVVVGSANTNKDYSAAFIGTLEKGASVKDCYVEVFVNQTASSSGNYGDVRRIIGSNNGLVESVIFNVSSANDGGSYSGIPLQSTGRESVYKNVALVAPTKKNAWVNGVYNDKLTADQLDNVVYYANMGDLLNGNGQLISSEDNKLSYTAIEEAQDLGESIVIKSTGNSGTLAISGKTVYSRTIKTIWNKEDFIKAMNEATGSDVYMLMRDLSFTTEDFTKVANTSTGVKNKDIYLVKEFKGTLLGAGRTIRWYLNDTASTVGTNTVSESNVKGLIETLAVTARISEVRFIGESVVDADGQAAFITNMNGTIEDCYIDATRRQTLSSSKNWQSTGGIFCKNEGTIRNCIIIAKGPTGATGEATRGAKLVYGGTTAGIFENIALIQPEKNIGTRNGANSNSYIYGTQLNNVIWYDSIESLVRGVGELVTNEDNDKAFEYEPALGRRSFSDSILVEDDKIYLASKLAWTDDKITANTEAIEFTQDLYEEEQITVYVDGVESTSFTFSSSDESVVTVSDSGLVQFVGVGKANVIATYKVDGSQVVIKVEAKASNPISTPAELIALSGGSADTYAYLTQNIILTDSDAGENTSFVPEFNGTLDGKGYRIAFTYGEDEEKAFDGLFGKVNGTVRNLSVVGTATTNADYSSAFVGTLASGARVENVYVEATLIQTASPKGNWGATMGIISSNNGTVEDALFNVVGIGRKSAGDEVGGISLQVSGSSSVYKNVATVMPAKRNSWRNGVYNNKLLASQMDNVVYYATMGDFATANGELISCADNTFSYTAITSAQSLGDGFVADSTLYAESVKFMNKTVWEREVIEVDTEEKFITAMNKATDSTVVKLTEDLTFTTSDFTKVLLDSSKAKSHYTTVIDSFKGILLGNGHKLTYTYDAYSDGTTVSGATVTPSNTNLRGFFGTVGASAIIKDLHVVGTATVDGDGQYVFIYNNKGTIEDCYLEITRNQLASSSSYWERTGSIFGAMPGTVKNTVINAVSHRPLKTVEDYCCMLTRYSEKNLVGSGSTGSGLWENVAQITPKAGYGTSVIGTLNGNSYSTEYAADKMDDLVYYESVANFLAGTGETVGIESSKYSFTAITSAQDLGSAWTVDATGIKLNGRYVYTVSA